MPQDDHKIKQLIRQYLSSCHIMQLATIHAGKPWSCTVYYVADNSLNLYWASIPSRRHSKDIANCDDVSISVPVEYNKDKNVIGIQAEGKARMLTETRDISPIASLYADKFGRNQQWARDFSELKTEHRLYRFTPLSYVLFDEQNFTIDPRKEISL